MREKSLWTAAPQITREQAFPGVLPKEQMGLDLSSGSMFPASCLLPPP